ncbi:hypothetical protein H6G36_06655 [Anabaena minutissima FACHB-250]|nr:hypothetical protein [Anabaena minutissima FACHB-250]
MAKHLRGITRLQTTATKIDAVIHQTVLILLLSLPWVSAIEQPKPEGWQINGIANLGESAKPYIKDIATILQDKSVDVSIRAGTAVALATFPDAAKPYVKNMIDILKKE